MADVPGEDGTIDPARLLPCPFCGGPVEVEAHPSLAECARVACASEACGVRPRTEYLLLCYADELCAAWNQRPAS